MTSRWVGLAAILALAGTVPALPGCHGKSEEAKPAAVQTTAPTAASALTPAMAHQESAYSDDLVLLAEGDPDFGDVPLTVKFTVESLVSPDMKEPKYTWNFGDGSAESQEAAPTHTFTKVGEYDVTVRVIDADGVHGWDEVEVDVEAPDASANPTPEPTK
jgi:PKD domain